MLDVSGREAVRQALRSLRRVPILEKDADDILKSDFFEQASTVLSIPEADKIVDAVQSFHDDAELIELFLASILPLPEQHYLGVRLPEGHRTTDQLVEFARRIHLSLDQPIRRLGHGSLEVSLLDVGSQWIELAATAKEALPVIGTLLGLAMLKYQRSQQLVKLEQERAKLKQEQSKATQEQHKADQELAKASMAKMLVEARRLDRRYAVLEAEAELEARKLELEVAKFSVNTENPGETETALSVAVSELAELIENGTEFRLRIDSPPDVQELFPAEALFSSDEVAQPQLLTEKSSVVGVINLREE